MSKFSVVVILSIVFFRNYGTQNSNLLSVALIYRHGHRAPLGTYKNDPYNNSSYWGVDYGQLTNTGKMQLYELGKWLRKRYDGFLSRKYSDNDIKVVSSDKDRCLMSAAANLAGLYPPEGDQIWNENLLWQPIPINIIPDHDDALLKQTKFCPKYVRLYREELRNERFQKIMRENANLFKYVSEKSGEDLSTLEDMKTLFGIIQVQKYFNVTLPDWTKEVYEKMECLSIIEMLVPTSTIELARLKTGPLIDQIISHFDNIIKKKNVPKFLMYSAHDNTLINIMNGMQIFDNQWPDFAAVLIFELRKDDERYFVNILYRSPIDLVKLNLKGCKFDCDISKFKETLAAVRISLKDWHRECIDG